MVVTASDVRNVWDNAKHVEFVCVLVAARNVMYAMIFIAQSV